MWMQLIQLQLVMAVAAGVGGPWAVADRPAPGDHEPQLLPLQAVPPAVSLIHEVLPVLTRAGCNAGACHGNLNGKGGFKLSLKGEDPAADYQALTREMFGRRVDIHRPDSSLILQKATGLTPHEGGIRITPASREYAILRDWIAAGCPNDAINAPKLVRLRAEPQEAYIVDPDDRLTIRCVAQFANGTERDVTDLVAVEFAHVGVARWQSPAQVVREGFGDTVLLVRYGHLLRPVRLVFLPNRPTFDPRDYPSDHPIDRLVIQQLARLRIPPAELADDATFLRRAYLDALGQLPSVEETRAFLADRDPHKRERLIDELLARPEFAEHWASKWADVLRVERKTLDNKGVSVFHRWLVEQIAQDRPVNQIAYEILSATGSTYAHPPANFWRAIRDPLQRAESVAQVFLGVRINCARCHNHPFDRWTIDDYYQFAAFFQRLDYHVLENNRRDRLDTHEFVGEQIVYQKREGELIHPKTRQAARPRVLGGTESLGGDEPRLQAVAAWVANPANPLFAAAQVNRIWYHLLGRGLSDPIDDLRVTNPPSHPELMAWLVRDLREHDFRLKHLVRRIMTSRTYQASSVGRTPAAAEDEAYHSRALVRPLTAEQLLQAISQVCEVPLTFQGYPAGLRPYQVPAPPQSGRRNVAGITELFLKTFGQPDRLLTCECERNNDPGMLQAFQLITGELLQQMLRQPNNRLGRLLSSGYSEAAILEELYLAALCRPPTPAEQSRLLQYVRSQPDRRAAWEDVLWAILNSKEFLVRQ